MNMSESGSGAARVCGSDLRQHESGLGGEAEVECVCRWCDVPYDMELTTRKLQKTHSSSGETATWVTTAPLMLPLERLCSGGRPSRRP